MTNGKSGGIAPGEPSGQAVSPSAYRGRPKWARLGIGGKLLLGYGILAALVLAVSLVSLVGLRRLNIINESIMNIDVPTAEAAGVMIDAVLAQESHARRSTILASEEMMEIFWERSRDFHGQLDELAKLGAGEGVPLQRLRDLHGRYNESILKALGRDGGGANGEAPEQSAEVKRSQEELISALKEVSAAAHGNQQRKTEETARLGAAVFRIVVGICAVAALLSVVSAVVLARSIALPLTRLKAATEKISEGRYDEVPDISSQDEVGDLSHAFSEMARRLKRLEEMYIDTQPLTRLPGSIAIENLLSKRLATGEPFAFCFVDMDNFKAFNDRYGYARGSELIKAAARLLEELVRERGKSEDFVGHIGGDDFVVLSAPDRFRPLCREIISRFDAMVPSHYDEEDRLAGHILSKTRQGQEQRFPLITVSIAVLTNSERSFENTIQIGELAAELKEYAKSIEGSVYVVDRRRDDAVEGGGRRTVAFPQTS